MNTSISHQSQPPRALKRILLLLLAFTVGMLANAAQYQPDPAKVHSTLNVRSAPSRGSATIHQYQVNDHFEVIEFTDGWANVSVNGRNGYVSAEYITKVPESYYYTRPAPQKKDDGSNTNFNREYKEYLTARILPGIYNSFPSDTFCIGTICVLLIIGIAGWYFISDRNYNYEKNRVVLWIAIACWFVAALLSVSYFTNAPNAVWFVSDGGILTLIVGCVILAIVIFGIGWGYMVTLEHIYKSKVANITSLVPVYAAAATGVTYVIHHIFGWDLSTWLPSVCLVAIPVMSVVLVIFGIVDKIKPEALVMMFLLSLCAGLVVYLWASVFFMLLSFILFLLCCLALGAKIFGSSPSRSSASGSSGGGGGGGDGGASEYTNFNTEHGLQYGYWDSNLFNADNGHRYTRGGRLWD